MKCPHINIRLIYSIYFCLIVLFFTACKLDKAEMNDIKGNVTEQISTEVNKMTESTPDPIITNSSFDPPVATELNLIAREDGQFDTPVDIKYNDPNGKIWTAPKGTITDGASIPDNVTLLFGGKMNPKHLRAAIVHDAYCGKANKSQSFYQKESWKDTHRMFYQACLKNGTDKVRSGTMYAAVRLGGPRWSPDGQPLSGLKDISKEAMTKAVLDCKAWLISKGGSVSIEELESYLDKLENELIKVNG